MNDFPEFMRHPYNKVFFEAQQARGIEGYVFDGADGGQVVFWTCKTDGQSGEHSHDFDEYLLLVQGQFTLIMGGQKIQLKVGQEHFIPQGTAHAGEYLAGTRTINAFGGRRVKRAISERV